MKKTLIASLVAASLVSAAGVAAAGDMSGFAGQGSGAYAGVNVGYGMEGWKSIYGASLKDKNGLVYGLNVGYMFNTNLGVELAYDAFSNTKIEVAGQEVGEIKNQNAISIMSVLNFPIQQQFSLFAKLGMSYLAPKSTKILNTEVKAKVWAPTMAIGASYHVMPNVDLNAQLKYILEQRNVIRVDGEGVLPGGDGVTTPHYLALTVGVNYKF